MSFESFKSQVRASALMAAEAARSVATLDQMAADDQYIHSDGLNLSTKIKRPNHDSQKLKNLIYAEDIQQSQSLPGKVVKHQSSLLPIVSGVVNDNRRPGGKSIEYEADESDDDDDAFDDPIMSMIRKTKSNRDRQPSKPFPPNNPKPVVVAVSMEIDEVPRIKNPQRFMSDLEDRISRVVEADPEPNIQNELPVSGTHSGGSLPSRWNLLQSITGTSIIGQYLSQRSFQKDVRDEKQKNAKFPLVSRQAKVGNMSNEEDEDLIQAVGSSSILGTEEAAELEKMHLLTQQSSDLFTMAFHIVKDNPHHVFIVLTLVLGSASYFYSRHRGTEDDVT